MARVPKKYLPGPAGTVEVDGETYKLRDIKPNIDPGLWDATNEDSEGWTEQGTSSYTAKISGTILSTPTQPTPVFKAGEEYPVTYKVNGTVALAGNFIFGVMDGTVDLKGGISFGFTATSQGPCTGTLVPDDILPDAPSGS